MILNKDFRPWLACAKLHGGRDSIACCLLDIEKKLLISADGRILVKLPVTIEPGDVSGNIPAEALKQAAKIKRSAIVLDCTDAAHVRLPDGRTYPRPTSLYPAWEQVIPSYERQPTIRISFNPVLLSALHEAMGGEEKAGVTLEFRIDDEGDAERGPVLVRSNGVAGVLMPFKSISRAPNRIDDPEKAHAQAITEKQGAN